MRDSHRSAPWTHVLSAGSSAHRASAWRRWPRRRKAARPPPSSSAGTRARCARRPSSSGPATRAAAAEQPAAGRPAVERHAAPAAVTRRGRQAQAEAVRRTWQQRPPLAPEKNPLLGRWESLGTGRARPARRRLARDGQARQRADRRHHRRDVRFDARPRHDRVPARGLVAIGGDGRERPMYRAEYRGGGSRVVVLPQGGTTFTHMIIDFDGADHATVAAVGCGLRRAGGQRRGERRRGEQPAAAADPARRRKVDAARQLGRERRHGRLRRAARRSAGRATGADVRTCWTSRRASRSRASPSSRRATSSSTTAPAAPAHAGDDRLCRAHGQGRVVASDHNGLPWEEIPTSGLLRDYWKTACTKT